MLKFNKSRLLSSGSAIAAASLSLLMGVQIAAYARPMTACENGDRVVGECTTSYYDPTDNSQHVTIDYNCTAMKCHNAYQGNNDAEYACNWCAEH